MSEMTGDTLYGDYLEEMIFNAAQGSRKKDEKAVQYNSTPNQLFVDEQSSHYFGRHHLYAPIHPTSCCAVNSVIILPEFIRHLCMVDNDGNLHINA